MQSGLHSHLLCELFDGMLDLCGVERDSVLSLPVFEMVKKFCLLFSSLNLMILKIGKPVLKVGKMLFLLLCRRSKQSFHLICRILSQYHLSYFFLSHQPPVQLGVWRRPYKSQYMYARRAGVANIITCYRSKAAPIFFL